jgi:aminoglycoside phosphotransferase (APT) family kinase protein
MIRTRDLVQGDLIDPITGERLVLRIPPWFGAAALASSTEVAAPLDIAPDPVPAPRGVWTEAGYLAPGTF